MNEKLVNTREFAEIVRVKPGTILRAVCTQGHYLGIKPLKLKNRRLLWPESEVDKAIHREAA